MNRLIDRKYDKRNKNMSIGGHDSRPARARKPPRKHQHRQKRMSMLTFLVRQIMKDKGVDYQEARHRADEIMAKQQRKR